MRSLGGFLWCALLLLQYVRADPQPCNPAWRIPKDVESCTQIIKWKAHNVEQATATCQEYFPTTFAYGEVQGDTVKCTVHRQFQCEFQQKSFSIFDKCYYFEQKAEVTLDDYLDPTKPPATTKCPAGGKLPVFLTMTQAKHIAKRANMMGIAKMWVNLDSNGRLIEDVNKDLVKGFMLHKELWKLNKETWWDGEKLEKSPPRADAENLFFRTDTDYVRNLWQGNFELATKQAKATIVCEYPANIVPNQKRYCDKMGELGLKTSYDTKKGRKRCLYPSLTKYPMKGSKEAIQNFPGCKELPSSEQIAGLDDGTASKEAYNYLTDKGTYRVAAIKTDTSLAPAEQEYIGQQRGRCQSGAGISQDTRDKHRQPYVVFDHFMKPQFTRVMSSPWAAEYPMNECTDFPTGGEMDSNTLAIRNKEIIDVPVPVRFKAICSIESNVDCNLRTQKCRQDQKCTNVAEWNKDTGMYSKCECHQFHKEVSSVCEWEDGSASGVCGKGQFYPAMSWKDVTDRLHFGNDLVRVVVRRGCTMTVWSHPLNWDSNLKLLTDVTYGEYEVPNYYTGTLNGWQVWMSADALTCTC